MDKHSWIIVAYVMVSVFGIGSVAAVERFTEARNQYSAEMKCVNEMVDLGFERKRVIPENGSCYVIGQ